MKELIVKHQHPVLRAVAREISLDLIGGKTLNQEIALMKQALAYERGAGGVALSAPQVGVSKRMFIVSGEIMGSSQLSDYQVFINPTYIKQSKKTDYMEEGCLSIPYQYGRVKRHTNVTISYYDEEGNYKTRGSGGFLSHVIQHEIDHLDGILFIDKAENLQTLKGRDRQLFDQRRENYINSLHESS